jgi:uncharacterized protein (DUF58 family)
MDEAFLRRLERLSIEARKTLRGVPSGGEHPSRQQLPTAIFSSHRPYTPGDDYRSIDWNAYARQEEMVVKLGETEQVVDIHILLDRSQSMAWGEPSKLFAAQQLTAAMGYLALAHNDRLRVAPFSAGLPPPFGPTQSKVRLPDLLRFIDGQRPSGHTTLAANLRAYARAHERGGLLVLCSDLLAEPAESLAEGLRALPPPRWQVLVLHLLDRRELEPEIGGPLELEDAETGQRIPLTLDEETIAGYRQNMTFWQQSLAEACGRYGAVYAPAPTDWPVEQQVLPYLRRRRIIT